MYQQQQAPLKTNEDFFFTPEKLHSIRGCNMRVMGRRSQNKSEHGRYSEHGMSQAIAKLVQYLEEIDDEKEDGVVVNSNKHYRYQKYRVKTAKATSFFTRAEFTEEEMLLKIEALRRSPCVVKKKLMLGANNVMRVMLFDTWWNYALWRIFHIDSENNSTYSIFEYTAGKIIVSLFEFVTKDLGDIVRPGSSLRKQFGVDVNDNVKTARRVLDHCDLLDSECSLVEAYVNRIESPPGASSSVKSGAQHSIQNLLSDKKQPHTHDVDVCMAKRVSTTQRQASCETLPSFNTSKSAFLPTNNFPQASTISNAATSAFGRMAVSRPPVASVTLPTGPSSLHNTNYASSETLYYEAPVTKPLPQVFAHGSDITEQNSIFFREPSSTDCSICLQDMASPDATPICLHECGHRFHLQCIRDAMKHQCSYKCPECRIELLPCEERLDYLRGNMPSGTMSWKHVPTIFCAGYEKHGSIVITYNISPALQQSYHPNPGQRHGSAYRTAYIPDNSYGNILLCRLKCAFLCGLTFTVGESLTSNKVNQCTWASVHHKTSPSGGMHGFPDENYLANCNAELDAMGVPSFEICAKHVAKYKSVLTVNRPRRNFSYFNYRNRPSFYEQSMKSLVSPTKGFDLVSIMKRIDSKEFLQFAEENQMMQPAVELSPYVYESNMYKAFMEECSRCISGDDTYELQVVFHGTPEHNIDNILRNGLDPSLRRRQVYGQGEYFASNPVLPYQYCNGGGKMLVFAVITEGGDAPSPGIIVVNKSERQLPIATLSFASLTPSAMQCAVDFQRQVSMLLEEKNRKEKLASEAKSKEKIIKRILEREYEAASDLYLKACDDKDGMPPSSWRDEVAAYVRDHIRDETFVEIYFPNLPPRPISSSSMAILNSEICEAEAKRAKLEYERVSSKNKS